MGTGSMVLFGLLEHRMAFQESAVASTRVWAHRLWDPIALGTPSPLGLGAVVSSLPHLFRIHVGSSGGSDLPAERFLRMYAGQCRCVFSKNFPSQNCELYVLQRHFHASSPRMVSDPT